MILGFGIGLGFGRGESSQTNRLLALLRSGSSQLIMHPLEYGSMFQDRAGTVPVTASGQLVGLAMDWGFTGKKPESGPELVVNGGFAAGATGWSVSNADATHIITFGPNGARYQSDTTTPLLALSQNGVMVSGKSYLVEIEITDLISGTVKTDFTGGSIGLGAGVTRFIDHRTASGNVIIYRNSANVDLVIKRVSIRELPGYHATAISDSARGIFRDVGGKRWIEYNGVNTAYQTPVLPAPGVDKAQVFAGLRKLSDAATGLAIELSNNAANNGSFLLGVPSASGANSYSFGSRGTNLVQVGSGIFAAAPDNAVLTGIAVIAGDVLTLRRNGALVSTNAADQGTGNYNPDGTYPLYYGARAGTTAFFNGYHYRTLGPIVRFGTNATPEQIAAAEAYYTAGLPA